MNIAKIIELQLLAEHIKYLRGQFSNRETDDLIVEAKKAYKRLCSQIEMEVDREQK